MMIIDDLTLDQKRALLAELLQKKSKKESESIYPLSYGQEALWFVQQLAPESAAYNVNFGGYLPTDLDIPAFRRAFQRLVDRHASLRTSFPERDGKPFQQVHKNQDVHFMEIEASSWSRETVYERLVREAHRPFDLKRGPLLRVTLFTRQAQHILLVSVHHMVYDAISLVIILDELRVLYPAEKSGIETSLPSIELQYTDYVRWQKKMLQSEEGERLRAFWQKQLAGDVPVLNLHTDRHRPPVQTYCGAIHAFKINKEMTQCLKALARAEGVTPYQNLLAGFQVLLYRCSGQEDILMGTPMAGRNKAEFEGLVGYFMNPVVLRADLSGNPTFKEFLSQVNRTVLEAFENQDYPFPLLVEQIQPIRDPSRSPLFQAMFNMPKAYRLEEQGLAQFVLGDSGARIDLGGLDLEIFAVEHHTAMFDLLLTMVEAEGTLSASLEYNTDLFNADTIARLVEHFQTLLGSIVANPAQKVSDLPILTDAERHQLLTEWNSTRVDYPRDFCFQELFEEQAGRTPDTIAVVFEEKQLSYRQLNLRTDRLARLLVKQDIGTDTVVAVLADRGIDLLTAIIGIFKAGGSYLPLDPHHPSQRLFQVLNQGEVPLVLAADEFIPALTPAPAQPSPGKPPEVLELEYLLRQEPLGNNLPPRCTPNDLAYVIYTSGSTGVPKGVMIEHRGMLNHLYAKISDLQLTAGDSVAQTASQCFDISLWQFLAALLVGGRVCIVSDEIAFDPQRLIKQVEREKISVVETVPSLLRVLLAEITRSGDAPPDLSRLRWMIPTGESLSPDLCRQWQSCCPDIPLLNAYGPTECSDDVTHHPVYQPPTAGIINMPIGRPIANMRIYVLDPRLQPVPIGIPGELSVGGVGVGRGYLNDVTRTAEVFILDPFALTRGARMFKTGDRARFLPDGSIEFLGRIDYQVKVRGYRIELGEIEAALAQHPEVHEVVALVREDVPGDRRLVAYVVPNPQQPLTVSRLRGLLKEKLPNYMIPSAFVILKELPLTPNGKVDRRALPMPDRHRAGMEETFVAPRTQVEETLAGIWCKILNLDRVGVYDNFFELGGDSILGLQVIARAAEKGLRFSPVQLLQAQTIDELSAIVSTTTQVHAEQGPITGPVPLTPIQHWFFQQDIPEPHHFNQAVLFEVVETLDPSLLEKAFQQLLVHHDSLRLRFISRESGWEQEIKEPGMAELVSSIDLASLSDIEQESALEAAAAKVQASLNLLGGPLLRVTLFDLGNQNTGRLLLVCNHLVIDAVSWRILLEDLHTAYWQLKRGEPIQLPPKTTSFKHWSQKITEYAQTNALKEELSYWQSLPWDRVPGLPVDNKVSRDTNTEASARTLWSTLEPTETRQLLQDVPQVYNTQINDVLLTALAQAFTRWTGSRLLLVDLESHGREGIFEDVDLSRTVGWFTTIFPVLLDLEDVSTPGDALKSVKEQLRRVPNRGFGYGLLKYLSDDIECKGTLQALPQSEVCFNYLGQFDQVLPGSSPMRPASESSGPIHSPHGSRYYLLDVNAGVTEGRLRIAWTYSKNLHQHDIIQSLAQEFLEALRMLIAHCMSPEAGGYTPSDFPQTRLPQEKLDKIISEFELNSDSN